MTWIIFDPLIGDPLPSEEAELWFNAMLVVWELATLKVPYQEILGHHCGKITK